MRPATPIPEHPERLRALEDLFGSVLEADPATRQRLLDSADPDLRAEVRRLLDASTRAEQALESPRWDLEPDPPLAPGAAVGRYTIVREIGRGGMGVVYLARQTAPTREVALKVCSLRSDAAIDRFRREAETLARLQHPGIATVFESGVHPSPHGPAPYLAMEYVQGRRITQCVEEQRPGPAGTLKLIIDLCDAVEHAHQRAVLHRDIKPANILVEKSGRLRLVDFGVAALIDDDPARTSPAELVGTLPYMSPEQAAGGTRGIDARSDVYAIGAVLYRLLTGALPIPTHGRGPIELLRAIREDPHVPATAVAPQLARDLGLILDRALAKSPDERYPSAGALRDDIRRFLRHEPISARPHTPWYAAQTLIRRHRALSVALGLCTIAVIGGAASTAWQLYRVTRTEALAVARLAEARKLARSLLVDVPGLVQPLPGSIPVQRELMRRALDSMEILLAGAQDPASLAELGNAYLTLGSTTGSPDAPSTQDFPEGRRLVEAGVGLLERAAAADTTTEIALSLARAYSVRSGFASTREERLDDTTRAIAWERTALARSTDPVGSPAWASLASKLAYDLARAGADAATLGGSDAPLTEGLTLMERVASLRPDDRGHALTLAILLNATAIVLEARDPPRSDELARRAAAMLREHLAADPSNYSATRHLAAASSTAARHLARAGHGAQAIAHIDAAASEAAPIMAADPANSLQSGDLAELRLWQAEVRCLAAEAGAARPEDLDSAVELLDEAIQRTQNAPRPSGASPTDEDRLSRLRQAMDRARSLRTRLN